MSYDALELARHSGKPVELYRFVRRDQCWLYTSADQDITWQGETYLSRPVSRGDLERSQEASSDRLTVNVDRTLAVVPQFFAGVPATPVLLTITRFHRDDEDPTTLFSGEVSHAQSNDSQVSLLCKTSLAAAASQLLPRILTQRPCNHVLYDAGCGLDPDDWMTPGTVTALNGLVATIPEAAVKPDGFYKGGWLQITGTDIRAFIVKHENDQIKLLRPATGLAATVDVELYAGCDRTIDTCRDRFANVANHMGWPFMPSINPFHDLDAES